jgi:F-type H+-transporting ATPase subunit epsilon
MVMDLPSELEFSLVTPDRQVVRESVIAVSIPGKDGYLGILPGHAPLLTELKPGEVSYTSAGITHYLAVSEGFAEVLPQRVIVLAQASERPEEIDLSRAEEARRRAEEILRQVESEAEREEARRALERAMARLEVAGRALRP